jgi:hypothetical protein
LLSHRRSSWNRQLNRRKRGMAVRRIVPGFLLSFVALWGSLAPADAVQSAAAPPFALPAIIDGHADFAIHYLRRGWSVDGYDIERSLPGQADVPRWRAGGVGS